MTLIGYWSLNETSGDALDHSGNEHHGSVHGATQGEEGPVGSGSYDFNGSSNYVSTGFPSNKTYSSGLSVNAWIYPRATGNHTIIMQMNPSNSSDGYFIFRMEDDHPDWRVRPSGSNSDEGVNFNNYPQDRWAMVTGVYRPETGERELYLDGESQGVIQGNAEELDIDNSNTDIGRDTRDRRYFDGNISELRIYRRPLTKSEIQYLYNISKRGLHTTSTKKS